jgi:hypothetical protein
MRNPLRLVLVASVLAFALGGTAVASAATVSWAGVDVTLTQDEGGSTMLVAGTLAGTAALPAEVELSVPASSTLEWIGQVLGGDTTLDPDLSFTKATAGGVDVYHATLTQSRTAQIEVVAPAIVSTDGVTYHAALTWKTARAIPSVRMTVIVPAGAQIVQAADGATLQPGDATNSYYYKVVDGVKAGTKLDLTFSYTKGTAAASGGATSSGSGNTLLIFLAILLVVAAAVVAAVAVRIRMSARSSDDGDGEDE